MEHHPVAGGIMKDNRTRTQKLLAAVKRGQERRKLSAEEEALVDAMRRRVEGAGPEMVDVRYVPETDAERGARLVGALDWAAHIARRGDKLPPYLEDALLRFDESMKRAADLAMVKNAVNEAHDAGAPLNRAPAQGIKKSAFSKSAFDIAADRLGLSPEMVESIYYGRTPNDQPYPQKSKTPKK